jgi:hypothetical protein
MLCHQILCEAWRICYCDFLEGREQVEDEPHVGRPSTSETDYNVEK